MNPKSFMGWFGFVIVVIWLITVNRNAKAEIELLKKRQIKGSIKRMFMEDDEKNYTIIFTDNTESKLPYSAPSEKIVPGDSMFKDSNSFKYVFFINGKVDDTIIFNGMVDGKYMP